jgi:hypothetical protein
MRFASLIFWHNLKVKLDLLVFGFFAVVAHVHLLPPKKVNEGVSSDVLLLRAGLFGWQRRSLFSPEVTSALSVVDQLSRHSCGSLCIVDVVDVVDERRG